MEDTPLENFLILDGYAFDVEELEAYASVSSNKLYINPHITDPGVDKSFSDPEKEKLRNPPLLGEFARALDKSIK